MSEARMNDPDNADLSRAYAATPRDEPPAELDDAILARARSALLTGSRSALLTGSRSALLTGSRSALLTDSRSALPAQTSRTAGGRPDTRAGTRYWSQLAAIAATLVITASLVALMQNEQPQIAVPAPAASDAVLAPAAKTPNAAVQPAETASREAAQRPVTLSRAKAGVPAGEPAPEQFSTEREQPVTPAPPLADAAKAATLAIERQAFPASRMAPAEDSRTPAAAVPPVAAKDEAGTQPSGAAAPAAARLAAGAALAERRSLPAAESMARSRATSDTLSKPESPEDWLARIAKMRKEGRAREADESLAEFRKRYPDYPIPAVKAQTP